jgi:hypothetical protein
MRRVNNFIYVTNVQQGACLLFDRKGLGCFPSKGFSIINTVKKLFTAKTRSSRAG